MLLETQVRTRARSYINNSMYTSSRAVEPIVTAGRQEGGRPVARLFVFV